MENTYWWSPGGHRGYRCGGYGMKWMVLPY